MLRSIIGRGPLFVPNLWPIIHKPNIASGACGKWLGLGVPADFIGKKMEDYPIERIHREYG